MTEEERRRMASSAVPKFPEGQKASVRDWSQNPAVAAAMKTGNISEIEKATVAARDAFRAGGTWAEGARQVPLNPTPALQQRTPEQQQDLLAQMRERGGAIRQRLEQESTQRGYAFRQGLAETEAQRALTPAFGGSVTRGAAMRGAQAQVEAERWKQAQAGRSPMSREPISALGFQFQRVSMGQYSPTRSLTTPSGLVPSGGPQPATAMQTIPSATGSIASGFLPTFADAGSTVAGSSGYASFGLPRTGNQVEDWWRENYPQDYSVNQYGIGRRMIARRTPFEQNTLL